jgi:hypothetical protein
MMGFVSDIFLTNPGRPCGTESVCGFDPALKRRAIVIPSLRDEHLGRPNSLLPIPVHGGKCSATPLSHAREIFELRYVFVRPKALSPLRSASALQDAPRSPNAHRSHGRRISRFPFTANHAKYANRNP